jgi:hypothetical protein
MLLVTDASRHCGCECGAAQNLCDGTIERLRCAAIEIEGRAKMLRLYLAVLISAICATAALAQSAPSASPVCVYESKSYSDGALLCINSALMLGCSLDGGRASWKPVTDQTLAPVCASSPSRPRVVEAPPRPRHRHGIRRPARVNADGSAKCFVFNGRQYCE